jgi:hypothetical protein
MMPAGPALFHSRRKFRVDPGLSLSPRIPTVAGMRWLVLGIAMALVSATPALAVSGGETVDIKTAPYVVGLGSCTGTLIAPDRVLTAAHCVQFNDNPETVGVVIGEDQNTRPVGPDAKFASIRGFATMPGYKLQFPFSHKTPESATAVNDIALVLLAKPVTDIVPLAVAGPGDAALEQPGTPVRLLGYGDTTPFVPGTAITRSPLQGGNLSLISTPDCLKAYPRAVVAGDICGQDLSHDGALTEPCAGDSGGPLIAQGPNGPVQIGVTSWGSEVMDKKCGQAPLPAVWMRVSAFHAFITDPDPVIRPYTRQKVRITGTRRLTCSTPVFKGSPGKITYAWGVPRFAHQLIQDQSHPLRVYKGATSAHFTRSARTRGKKLACAVTSTNASGKWIVYSQTVAG